jgi:transketolase
MRSIPGMVILNPADDTEAKAAIKAALDYVGPVYLRFGRLPVPVFNDPATYKFEMGKGVTLREGIDLTIVATGLMVWEAILAAEALAKDGVNARVINIHTIKPLDEELVQKAAAETGLIVTVEEHNIVGGLGEAVCAAVCKAKPAPVVRIGVNDEFGVSGPAVDVLKKYGLSAENIVAVAKRELAARK